MIYGLQRNASTGRISFGVAAVNGEHGVESRLRNL